MDSVPRTLVHTCNLVLGSLRKEASKFNARIDYKKKDRREGRRYSVRMTAFNENVKRELSRAYSEHDNITSITLLHEEGGPLFHLDRPAILHPK